MGDMLRRLMVFTVVACGASYVILLFAGKIVEANTVVPTPIIVRDSFSYGAHSLSGSLTLPSICDDVGVHIEEASTTEYDLIFTTWQDHSVTCSPGAVSRAFRIMAFAPASGIVFGATLDGTNFPIVIDRMTPDE